MTKPAQSEKVVGALVSGLTILEYLTHTETPIGVNQLARDLNLNPSTCFNLLKTLVGRRLVEFNDDDKTYRLGYGLVEMARKQLEVDPLVSRARGQLESIANNHLVTATLWRRMGDNRLILLDRADNGGAISVHMAIGRRIPLLVAATGRAMAAHLHIEREKLEEAFHELRWQNPPSFETYYKEAQEVLKNGFAIDQDNFWKGVTIVAAPILDRHGRPMGSLSGIGFSGQFTAKSLKALAAAIKRAGAALSEVQEPAEPMIQSKTSRKKTAV